MQELNIEQVIKTRRTIKPEKMNGQVIPDETIMELLALADWAPTHGYTEPWRFVVIANTRVKEFTTRHSHLYQQHTDPTKVTPEKVSKIAELGNNTSHVIISYMRRSPTKKVPAVEEIAAASAAIQNLLLAARAKGIASYWSTTGLAHHQVLKDEYNLGDEDVILGMIYLGYSDEPFKEGNRTTPLSQKIEWVR